MSESKQAVTVAYGDGIGPEIMQATLDILEASKAPLSFEPIEIGEAAYLKGISSGIPDEAWETILRNEVMLKAPITTPRGGGYKSLNVTLRKSLNMFANVRPTRSFGRYINAVHPDVDVVIVRENEEDLYAGIEHQQTKEVTQVLKLITRPGCERIVRYAFEYAKQFERERVTCMTKDNIMKQTDGLFHKVFEEIAAQYPEIESDHYIIDIGAARLAAEPELFDVIVTLNLYGDILSDIAALVAGSVGLAGSANIGPTHSMFEAVHGSAPDIAGKGIANPSGLLNGAIQMLVNLGEGDVAGEIYNAWLCTLEDGIHTADLYTPGQSEHLATTAEFAEAVTERLGKMPHTLKPVHYGASKIAIEDPKPISYTKELVGIDIFLDWDEHDRDSDVLGQALSELAGSDFELRMISNRGVRVYPEGIPETFKTDHWRCRFTAENPPIAYAQALQLQQRVSEAGYDLIKTENLYTFDGERGYSLGQGE